METKKFVAYYRVSTKMQGQSGLGLAGQETEVMNHISKVDGTLAATFTEIESGKKNNREQLHKALALAKELNATLIVAKLDRLSRDLVFIFTLVKNEVPFYACDLPQANTLMLGVKGTVGQYERELISERVKIALAEKKKQVGEWRVCNFDDKAREKAKQALAEKKASNPNTKRARAIAALYKSQGLTIRAIADKLNESGFETPNGKSFGPSQVQRLLKG